MYEQFFDVACNSLTVRLSGGYVSVGGNVASTPIINQKDSLVQMKEAA